MVTAGRLVAAEWLQRMVAAGRMVASSSCDLAQLAPWATHASPKPSQQARALKRQMADVVRNGQPFAFRGAHGRPVVLCLLPKVILDIVVITTGSTQGDRDPDPNPNQGGKHHVEAGAAERSAPSTPQLAA